MKVFFVGLHYKPGMTALDRQTISGKRIDMIISRLPEGIEAVKTNLFVGYEIPAKEVRKDAANVWATTYNPSENDVIFLLGGKVQRDFTLKHKGVVLYEHPAKVMSNESEKNYAQVAGWIIENFQRAYLIT